MIDYQDQQYTTDELLAESMSWDTINHENHDALHDAALALQEERDEALDALAALATDDAQAGLMGDALAILHKYGRLA